MFIPKTFAEHAAVGQQNHVEKFSIGGSRFTNVTPEGVREKLATCSTAQISKWLGELGEPESPSESLAPKLERLVMGWVDGRLPRLAIELGLEPTELDNRKRYGG